MPKKIRIYADRYPYIYGKVGWMRIRIYSDADPDIYGLASRSARFLFTVQGVLGMTMRAQQSVFRPGMSSDISV